MSCSKLEDINLSMNPLSNEQNYQNRVKEMLQQVKRIDDIHVDFIRPQEESTAAESLNQLAKDKEVTYNEIEFLLSKFDKFT